MRVNVKVTDDDHDSHIYNYQVRNLEITPGSKSFKTPQRILNNADLNAKAHTPTEITLNCPVGGFQFEIDQFQTEKLLTTNTYPETLVKKAITIKQQLQHSSLLIPFIQPANTAINSQLFDNKRKYQALRRILTVQKEANLPIISVPWLDYSTEDYLKIIDDLTNKTDREYIFYLKALDSPDKLEKYSQKIIENVETNRLNFVGVIGSPLRNAISSYDVLWENFGELDIGIVISNVERYDSYNYNLSSSHLNQCFLGDLFLPKVKRGFQSKNQIIHVKDKLRVFNKEELSVNPIRDYDSESWKNVINVNIPDITIKQKLDHYSEAENDSKKFNVLNYITKIHEFIASSNEFVDLQYYINNQEMDSYIESKPVLLKTLERNKELL